MKKLSYISEDFKNVGALYALKQDNKIVYIGCTNDVYRRINQHINSNKIFNDFSILLCTDNTNMNHEDIFRECAEQCLISDYKPIYNKLMCKNSFEYMALLPASTLKRLSEETSFNDFSIDYKNTTKDIYNLLELKDYEESLNLAIYIKKAK